MTSETNDPLAALTNSQGITLVDFTATWCPPCKALSPVLHKLASDYGARVRVVEIDVDEQSELAARFAVRGMPTVVLWRDDHEVGRFVGLRSRSFVTGMVERALAGDEAIAAP